MSTFGEAVVVRPGEELDWDRLEGVLREQLDVRGELSVQQFPNGSANLTYLLHFGEQRLVFRRPPFGELAPGAHDMSREFRVLSQLWQAYPRAPRAKAIGGGGGRTRQAAMWGEPTKRPTGLVPTWP